MDYKSKIVRSKSNSIDSEIRPVSKLCKSRKVQDQVAKKRGVYVERFSNTVIDNEKSKKSSVRVRPSEKKFLDSVLTILSKSSNGTQYPEANLNNTKTKLNKKSKPKNKPRTKINQIKEEALTLTAPNDVTNTPRTKSSKVKTKLDLLRLDSTDTTTDMRNTCNDNMERLYKEISIVNISDESMSETENFDNYNKKVNNICADLESTVSLHDDDDLTESPKGLQNEPLVDQLNNNKHVRKNRSYSTQFKTNSSKVIYKENEIKVLKDAKPIEKAARYVNKPLLPKSEKVQMRKGNRKRQKQNFINYLKQQLQMDNTIFQEPQSFFDTLKLIVRNKKKAAISINFHKAAKAYIDSSECMYKNSKSKNKNKKSN